ncbi:DNRLRE domain-containing protein [Thermoproteota archaeon]
MKGKEEMGSVEMRKQIICQRSLPKVTISLMAATLILCLVISPQTVNATLTIIQPSSADTYLDSILSNTNNNGYAAITVGITNFKILRSLVKFDLSLIPLGSTINTASLMLYNGGRSGDDPAGRTFTAYRITNDWVETQATWNSYRTGSSWDTAGGDFSTDGASSTTVPSSMGWMTWDVTAVVKAWIEGGQPNYGFLIRDLNEVLQDPGFGVNFDSKESIFTDWRPILEIDWSESAPTVEPAPVGGHITPINKLVILAPHLALAGLIIAVSTIYIMTRRRD